MCCVNSEQRHARITTEQPERFIGPEMSARTRNTTERDTDFLFKKPWTLSRKAEFMVGVGPSWVHLNENGKGANSFAGQIAGDFMFWPTGKHRFGWFLEPAYEHSFAGGHEQSVGMSAGLQIGIR